MEYIYHNLPHVLCGAFVWYLSGDALYGILYVFTMSLLMRGVAK